MKLKEIALLVGGRVIGDEEFEVEGVSSCDEPKPKTLVFCQDLKSAEKSKGKEVALVVSEPIEHSPLLLVEDVKYAMAVVLNALYPEKHPVGVSSLAYIGKDVSLGEDVYIAPFVYIGDGVKIGNRVKIYPFSYIGDNCFIGDDTVIFSGVCIYPKSVIGKGVRIHSGAVIGADGFGYHIGKEGITKLPHIGIVVVEDNVEIGANTTVDRALLDRTVIGKNTKIDNLVMIGHNCKIGENNIIVSQVGLSGSVKTGKNVVLAGQVGVADHISIGDNVVVSAKAGVSKNLEANKVYGGTIPAMEWSKWKRIHAYILKLPELFKSLSKSERKSGE